MANDHTKGYRLLSNFMSAGSLLELYLQQQGPFTPLQIKTLSSTVDGIQTFLLAWKTKHAKE